jgi:glycosyltransferase involved in cell wall biosynthesis
MEAEPPFSISSPSGPEPPVKVLLYRRSLSLTSGAGQLIRRQAEGLKAAGEPVCVACQRGAVRFFLRTRLPVKRLRPRDLDVPRGPARHFLVDHEMQAAGAGIVFVHNLLSEACRHLPRAEWRDAAAREARFFARLPAGTPVVANSELVRSALMEHFGLAAERIEVHRPGYDSGRFNLQRAAALRARARSALGLDEAVPLTGLITSGDFAKRGLDLFLAAAEEIAAARPDARFLVAGSRRLPEWAAGHPLLVAGRARYEPKTYRPEKWMAALDLFLYPAHFEEFGIVVAEALAMGVPVLTSRRVGAAEVLPAAYAPWLADAPDSADFAAKALALLDSAAQRRGLAAAGIEAPPPDHAGYVAATLETIRRYRPR